MSENNTTRTDIAEDDAPPDDQQPQTVVKPKFSLRLAIGMMALFGVIMLLLRFVGEGWSERKQITAFSIIFGWGAVTAVLVLLAIDMRGKMQLRFGRPIYQYSYTWVINFQAALVSNLFCYVFGAVGVVFLLDGGDVMLLTAPLVVFAIGLQLVFLHSILFPVQVACCEHGLCLRWAGMIRYESIRESRWTEDLQRQGLVVVWYNLQHTLRPEIDSRVRNALIPADARGRVDEILKEKLGDRHEGLTE